MIKEWVSGPLVCQLHMSISDIPGSLWDDKIAGIHPLKSSRFMRCLEKSFPDRQFTYLTIDKKGKVVALAVITEERFDLGLLLPDGATRICERLRKIVPGFMTFRLAMVGTFETAKRHWWVDEQHLSAEQFADHLLVAVEAAFPSAKLLIVRDLMEGHEGDRVLELAFLKKGFRSVLNLPLATVRLDGLNLDQHFARLKRKSRASIRKMLQVAEKTHLKLERLSDYRNLIDECYPLYLQVHQNASEFKRQPIPKALFHAFADQLSEESSMLTVRDEKGQLFAFILTGTSSFINNPFLIGMDYRYSRELPLYYVLLWNEIAYAAERGCQEVDMGVTSYFIKQTMGASLEGMSMAARIQPRWLCPLMNPLLPALLGAKQPRKRRLFRQWKKSVGKRHERGRQDQATGVLSSGETSANPNSG